MVAYLKIQKHIHVGRGPKTFLMGTSHGLSFLKDDWEDI